MLKPYDVAAGIVILEEAGGRVTTADGSAYSVFDRSLLATNDALYEQVCMFVLRHNGLHAAR
jgi:myo-inositol-1(or 4)-monophosphatase